MGTHRPAAITVLILSGLVGITAAGIGASEHEGNGPDPAQPEFEIHSQLDHSSAALTRAAGQEPSREVRVRFRNPLLNSSWHAWTGYVDLDPSTAYTDFECMSETYDGHNGNDQAILDFVAQDEGRFVVAAAAGTVIDTKDGYFDKETSAPETQGNEVIVQHDDGSMTIYGHFRRWSVMVYPGQEVFQGQALGLVGSSGQSFGPHLHFGVLQEGTYLEPHSGACRPGDSLWESQEDHFNFSASSLAYAGMSPVSPAPPLYLHRPPTVEHFQQTADTKHYFWHRMRYIHPGDVSRLVYKAPDGSTYRDYTYEHTALAGTSTWRWQVTLPDTGYLGTWEVDYYLNDVLLTTFHFVYDEIPDHPPVAVGRTVLVPRGSAGDALEGWDGDGDVKEFGVVTPPVHGKVALHGPRQRWFTYYPDSGFEGTDSFTFAVEDALGQWSEPATIFLEVAPVIANSLRLEGEDDHVSVPDNGSLNVQDAFTLEAWIRRTMGSAGGELLIDRRGAGASCGYALAIQSTGVLAAVVASTGGSALSEGTTPIPMDRWTHVAATWDGSTLRLYVNGELEPGEVGFSGPVNYSGAYPTLLGRSASGTGVAFRGDIDEMRIWSVARTAAELQAGADCAFQTGSPPASLRGWWRFNGDATDQSLYGNHGTVIAPGYFRRTTGALPFCSGADADSDGTDDLTDNCPLAFNPGQEDADTDGIGDTCDQCPGLVAARQFDSDSDGIADACDKCPFRADTDQSDADSDGTGDLCDPESDNGAVGVPAAVQGLSLLQDQITGETTMTWTATPLAQAYAVVRSSAEQCRRGFYGTCVSGSDPDPSDTTFVDGDVPAAGEFYGYLVAGVGADGVPGFAGLAPNGSARDLRAVDCHD